MIPTNILQAVQTYQMGELAYLQNSYCGISLANKRYRDFDRIPGNLGSSVYYDAPVRYVGYNGLPVTFQGTTQRPQTLSVTQALNIAVPFTSQEFIFNNIDEYMKRIGKAAAEEMGALIEADLLRNIITGVTVSDPQSQTYGQAQTNSGPYRYFGGQGQNISTFPQLAQAIANFKDLGYSRQNMVAIVPITAWPQIVQSGLNQFVMKRNEEMANTWDLGEWGGVRWYSSNLLPRHTSGSVGDAAVAANRICTLVNVNDPTGANVTQLTITEPTGGTSATAFKIGDMGQFVWGVSGKPDLLARSFIGHQTTSQPVQFVVTADAATTAGSATIQIRTINGVGLCWQSGNPNQNINVALQAGMQIRFEPSHTAGVLMSGDQFYLAMPKLPDQMPYPTGNEVDPESGASIRHYFGSLYGQNITAYTRDAIWGSNMLPDNCMRWMFPLNT